MNKKIKIEIAIVVITIISLIIGGFIWFGNRKVPTEKAVSDTPISEVKKEFAEDSQFFKELESSEVATGFIWNSEKGSPNFATVSIPAFKLSPQQEVGFDNLEEIRKKEYTLEIWDGESYVFYKKVHPEEKVNFPEGGVYRFRVTGISPEQGVCPLESNFWGISFATAGTFKGSREPITETSSVRSYCKKSFFQFKIDCGNENALRFYTKDVRGSAAPVLYFNKKLAAQTVANHTENGRVMGYYPRLPEITKNLVFHTYLPPDNPKNTYSDPERVKWEVEHSLFWNAYVDPEVVTKEEFNTIVACFEKNKEDIYSRQGFSNLNISSLVYSKELPFIKFTCPEGLNLEIKPDASWSFSELGQTQYIKNKHPQDYSPPWGNVLFDPLNPDAKPDFVSTELEKKYINPDFLRSCTRDSDGAHLDEVYNYKIL